MLSITRNIGILHRSSKEGLVKETEKVCVIEESVFNNGMKTLKTVGKWKCPFCGIETIADSEKKTVTPMISTCGVVGLNVDKFVKRK